MLLAPLLLALAAQTPSKSATTLADLVPRNTVAFLQAPSLERAAGLVERLVDTFSPAGAQTVDVAKLMLMLEVPGDAATVDPSKPVGVCLVLDETAGAEPLPVFLVPVRDADKYLKSVPASGSGAKAIAHGGYACVGLGLAPELPDAPAAIAQGLVPGELALRIDAGRLVEQFRDMIDQGLDQLEAEGASTDAAALGGIDTKAAAGAYIGLVRDLVDSVETLDLGLQLDGDTIELDFKLVNADGSALANLGSKDKTGARALAPLLDVDASFSLLMGLDMAALLKRFQPILDVLPAIYPEAYRPAVKYTLDHYAEMYGFMGTAQAANVDFAGSGFRYRAYSLGSEPQKLLDVYRNLAGVLPGFAAADLPEREVAGAKVRGLRLQLDIARLMKEFAGKPVPEGREAKLDELIEKIFGKDGLRIQVASKGGMSVLVLGNDDEYLGASIARMTAKAAPPAVFARALEQVGDLNPCVIVRYDIGRMMDGMKELFAGMAPGQDFPLPTFALSITAWGGVDGRFWRGGLSTDLAELAAVARLGAAPKLPPQEPRVVIPMLMEALDEYAINNAGKYPDSLEPLVTPDANGASYLEGYEGRIPKDPWNHEYLYEPPSAKHPKPRVLSYGSDGAPGGTGDAADIDSDSL